MLLTFCINAFDIHILGKQEEERLLYMNAAHVVALQVEPRTSSCATPRNKAVSELLIYSKDSDGPWRVPLIERNLIAFAAWQRYVEGQQ